MVPRSPSPIPVGDGAWMIPPYSATMQSAMHAWGSDSKIKGGNPYACFKRKMRTVDEVEVNNPPSTRVPLGELRDNSNTPRMGIEKGIKREKRQKI